MVSQRTLLVWIIGLTAACSGFGQTGLQASRDAFRIDFQAAAAEPSPINRQLGRSAAPGLNLKFVGRTAFAPDWGVYGRVGRSLAPAGSPEGSAAAGSYGIGVSWDFSRQGSAVLGWDSTEYRGLAGERDVRATSLGLQWRY